MSEQMNLDHLPYFNIVDHNQHIVNENYDIQSKNPGDNKFENNKSDRNLIGDDGDILQ